MPLYVLTETSAGYALFKASDKKLLSQGSEHVIKHTHDATATAGLLKLKKFAKFGSAAEALDQAAAVQDGKVTPMLQKLLDSVKEEKKASLAVADAKIGNAITKIPGLSLKPVADEASQELLRAVREHLPSLISDLAPEDTHRMRLGLSHSMSRHKLRFSTDKIDTMIIQAVKLLDDLDKEINQYAMRVKEWYGWHFPEMAKIINDNTAYARVIITMGKREKAQDADLATALPEEIEKAVKAAAEVSMGTEVMDHDMEVITSLAENVVELTDFRRDLAGYLEARMQAIAPNLTTLVGELVGARLIAHSGSLINLAKSPASTIQILGAEKALFRALKTRHDTPKYGLLYHASLVGQATGKNKGKIARMLATKTALGLRVDALAPWGTQGEGAEEDEPDQEEKTRIGVDGRLKLERRLRALEGKPLGPRPSTSIAAPAQAQAAKFEIKEARKYNKDVDGMAASAPARAAVNGAVDAMDVEEDDDDEDDDEEMADAPAVVNGDSKSDKAAKKAEKAARKAERAAKREAKAAKKAAKEAKSAAKSNGANGDADSGKKRKRAAEDPDAGDAKQAKKDKKKKSSA